MILHGTIYTLPREMKMLILAFLVILSVGYFSGLLFVGETSNYDGKGIEEQYLGNEDDEEAVEMRFRKSEKEILTLVHNHVLSMSIIFFLTGFLLCLTDLKKSIKKFLIIEPFVSIILTFGGLYLVWSGVKWMTIIVMISGILMTLCYTLAVFIIGYQLVQKKSIVKNVKLQI